MRMYCHADLGLRGFVRGSGSPRPRHRHVAPDIKSTTPMQRRRKRDTADRHGAAPVPPATAYTPTSPPCLCSKAITNGYRLGISVLKPEKSSGSVQKITKNHGPRQHVPLGSRCGAAVSTSTAPRRPKAGLRAALTHPDCALARAAPLRLTRPLCTGRQINLGSTVDERILSYAAARSQGGLQGGSSIPLGSSFRGHQHIPLGSSYTGALPCVC